MKNAKFVAVSLAAVSLAMLGACGGQNSSSAVNPSLPVSSSASSSVVASSSKTAASSSDSSSAKASSAAAFDTTKNITAYTRDGTSGTRDGFFSKIGLAAAKTDNAMLVSTYVEVASNGAMATAVANDAYGIGYISLSTLASSGLKGLKYENVEPSETNVLNGTYGLTRNFNYITRNDYASTSKVGQIVQAFVAFMGTIEGKATMKAADGIVTITGTEKSWSAIKANYPIVAEDNSALTVRFGGSTSVEKMAKALTAQFAPLCGHFIPSHNHTGSGDAYKHTQGAAKDDSGALDVGFLSRELELTGAENAAVGTYGKMCTDAIVAVVNSVNTYTATTAADLKNVYTGVDKTWSDLIK
jgi:phosphate transport system substrate-binding protein